MSHNAITALPAGMSGLKALAELSVAHNQLQELSGKVFTFTLNLQKMDASFNALAEINGSLYSLRRLTHLDLSHNNIAELDLRVGALVALSSLRLAFNAIATLPAEVAALKVTTLP